MTGANRPGYAAIVYEIAQEVGKWIREHDIFRSATMQATISE